MPKIRDITAVEIGDVLLREHDALAVVDDVAGTSVRLWDTTDDGLWEVDEDTLVVEWQLTPPDGFLHLAFRDPGRLRDLAATSPTEALRLLLEDLGASLTADAASEWVTGLHVVEGPFGPWWERAVGAVGATPGLTWDGTQVSLRGLDPSVPGDPEAFLTQRPAGRLRSWQTATPAGRSALLEVATEAKDLSAALLGLRGRPAVPASVAPALLAWALEGEPRLLAALLDRAHPASVRAVLEQLTADPSSPVAQDALDALPPSRRRAVAAALLDRSLEVGLAEGSRPALGAIAFPRGASSASLSGVPRARAWHAEATAAARDTLLRDRPTVSPEDLFPLALQLARAMATRHADGASGGVLRSRLLPDGTVALGAPSDSDPRRDVFNAARLLVECAIGELPRGNRVRANDLVVHLTQLVPAAPVDLLAVLSRALSPEPGLRPRNGLDLWEQLATAAASWGVRRDAPRRRYAALEVGHDTHIGLLKSRMGQTNQDALFWAQDGSLTLLLVADGISVSTAGSGDLASGILVQTASEAWAQRQDSLLTDDHAAEQFLVGTLADANDAICARAIQEAGGALGREIPMGTTALLALVRGDEVFLASLGDSRAYLVGGSGAAQLTGDQNVRGEWLRGHQQGNRPELINEGYALVGYCGHFNERAESEPVPPQVVKTRLLPGEVLALCSDGVTDYAAGSPAECALLFEEAAQITDLHAGSRLLVERANAGGGGDNITVILARQAKG